MDIHESITLWIDQLREGDSIAAERLWNEYFERMVGVARDRLGHTNRVPADEEDVALSAFNSFCVGAQNGQFGQLTDRTNLWPLLLAITTNKAIDQVRYENREKRGGPGAADRSSFERREQVTLDEILSTQPTPEFATQLEDALDHMMAKLSEAKDPDLQNIATWRLAGETNDQIAARLNCARRTVERKLQLISKLWGEER